MEPIQNSLEDQALPLTSAAAYVRMSTEHQQYSTSNQMDVIRDYAKHRGMQITKDYSDEGKSGLNIKGRDSLAQFELVRLYSFWLLSPVPSAPWL